MSKVQRVTAGIDWVSGTLPRDALDYQTWHADNVYALYQIAKEGYVVEMMRKQGYEGVGFGNTFVGEREDGLFAQFTGEKANYAYPYLEHPKVHISRIDLQITVQTEEFDEQLGETYYASATAYDTNLPQHRQRDIRRTTSKGGGYTLYVGAVSSPRMLRVYNKQAQSEDVQYTRCWRYEMVYRNAHSDKLYRTVLSKGDTATEFILSEVVQACRDRGIEIRGLEHIVAEQLDYPHKLPTDVERKLKWLRNAVKPTLQKLSAMGLGDQAAEALGLWIPHENP